MNKETDFIIQYTNWIKKNSGQRDVNGYTEITTPFLDIHNDELRFYAVKENNSYFFTDDGYTLADLEMAGINISTGKRKELLQAMADTMNIQIQDGAIIAKTEDMSKIAQTMHLMIQAMLKIGDMFMLSSSQVRSLFVDDVKGFFRENNIRNTASIMFPGKSGLPQRFDFVISASDKMPERLITTINHPTRQSIQSAMFAWSDVRLTRREETAGYIILNDKSKNSSSFIEAINKYEGMKAIPWSKRKEHIQELAA